MNIFATSQCPIQCAQEMTDVHVVKMILESAQLLSTAHFVLDGVQVGYKPTHKNHPCAVWCRTTRSNYSWLYAHFCALLDEFTFRTGKVHKSKEQSKALQSFPKNLQLGGLTPFTLCVPEEFTGVSNLDVHGRYQAYLNVKFAEWRSRDKPIKVEWTNRAKPSWATLTVYAQLSTTLQSKLLTY